jgi:hypothetical protein
MVKRATGAVLLAVIFGTTAHTQPTVHMLWSGPRSPYLYNPFRFLSVDPDARRILDDRPWSIGPGFSDLYITPDGALMVGRAHKSHLREPGQSSLTLRSMETGIVSSFSLPFDSRYFFGHPTRPEIYMGDSLGIVALSASGFRRVSSRRCQAEFGVHASLSLDGRRLATSCLADETFRGAVVDTASGVEVATFTGPSAYEHITLSRDGQEFYALTRGPNQLPTVLRRYAVSTETVLAEVSLTFAAAGLNPGGPSLTPYLQVDPRTGRLYVKIHVDDPMRVYDPLTLQELATFPSLRGLTRVAFDPHRPRAYRAIVEEFREGIFDVNASHFSIIDTDALEVLFTARLENHFQQYTGVPASVVVAPRPAAPTGLIANVQGTSVQLSWTPGPQPGTALRFVLEAGSGPALANLASFDLGLQTSLTVNAVPPGTYYVRVRPENVTGSGQPSNEIVVTVP